MSAINQITFEPANPLQDALLWTVAREAVTDGGIANGKSTAGVGRLLVLASRFPKSRWVIFRQVYLDLEKTTRRTFEKVCPAQWIKRDVRDTTELINGAEITWMHLDEMDEQSLRGLEINGGFGDQIEEIHPEMWEILSSRIGRWQLPEWGRRCPAYLWGTCNPEGKDWVYYHFHPDCVKYPRKQTFPEWDKTQLERAAATGLATEEEIRTCPPSVYCESPLKAYIFGTTLVNLPKMEEIDPTYVRNLLRKPQSWKNKWMYGNRSIFEGMIHKEFQTGVHVYDPKAFDPFKSCKIKNVWGFFDYGLSAPTCLQLVATDGDSYSYFFREYYGANRSISEHAAQMKTMIAEAEKAGSFKLEGIMADPHCFVKDTRDRKVTTTSIAEEYGMEGIYLIRADNNEDTSIEKINEALKVDSKHTHPVTLKQGSPHVLFSSECRNAIEQIQMQRWAKQRNPLTGENEWVGERDDNVADHAYDPVRYWANSKTDYPTYTGDIKIPRYGTRIEKQIVRATVAA